MYRDTILARSFDEAEKEALKILKRINTADGLQRLNYSTHNLSDRHRVIFGSFKKERKGESALIFFQPGKGKNQEPPYYSVHFYSSEEIDPSNYIQPFQNILFRLAIFAVEEAGSHFFRPQKAGLPVEVDPLKEDTIKAVSSYIAPGPYGSEENIYWDFSGSLPGPYEDKIYKRLPAPAVLGGIAGIDISSADDYIEAFGRAAGDVLNEEKKSELKERYTSTLLSYFLNYAAYEFFRTEDYSRLSEILSKAPEFGLSEDLDSLIASRGYPDLSAPVYILIQYLQADVTSTLGAPSLSRIATSTKTPKEVIYKAAKFPWCIPF